MKFGRRQIRFVLAREKVPVSRGRDRMDFGIRAITIFRCQHEANTIANASGKSSPQAVQEIAAMSLRAVEGLLTIA